MVRSGSSWFDFHAANWVQLSQFLIRLCGKVKSRAQDGVNGKQLYAFQPVALPVGGNVGQNDYRNNNSQNFKWTEVEIHRMWAKKEAEEDK